MTFHHKSISRSFFSLASVLLLSLLFTACSFGGLTGLSATPTPTPTPTPSPTPSPTPAPSLTNYSGDGYTIGYPQGWSVKKGSDGSVTFSDPQGLAYVEIYVVPNPGGVVSSPTLVDAGLQIFKSQVKNYQKVDIASSTTLAGDTWSQGSATGDITQNGISATAKVIVIADNHPASSPSTKGFTIAYATAQQLFELANLASFKPILASFKFV